MFRDTLLNSFNKYLFGPILPHTDLTQHGIESVLNELMKRSNCVSGPSEFIWKGFQNSVLWSFSALVT